MKDISDPVKNELGVRTTHVWHRAELSRWLWWWWGWIKRLRLNSWGQPCKSRNSPQDEEKSAGRVEWVEKSLRGDLLLFFTGWYHRSCCDV